MEGLVVKNSEPFRIKVRKVIFVYVDERGAEMDYFVYQHKQDPIVFTSWEKLYKHYKANTKRKFYVVVQTTKSGYNMREFNQGLKRSLK